MVSVLIPVGDLSDAKSRLAEVLEADARRFLSLAMLDDVVAACRQSPVVAAMSIVSADREALSHAEALGVGAMHEPPAAGGLNAGLAWALGVMQSRGVEMALVLPADIPLARPEDIAEVVRALGQTAQRCVVVPAQDGGTNALAMRPPGAVPLRFGVASAAAHLASAREAGLEATDLRIDRLAFDVDTPDDLALLPTLAVGEATARWLASQASLAPGPGR